MAFPKLTIGDLTARVPIIQGGMGIGISLANLAAAVANAGGVGVISAAGVGCNEPDYKTHFTEANSRALAKEIRKARQMTSGIIGVNIMVACTNYADLVAAAVDAGADIIFSGAGLPLTLPKFMEGRTAPKIAPIVSSARAAQVISKKWKSHYGRLPDAVVVEGPMAGGHLGFKPEQIDDPAFALEKLIPEVVAAVAGLVEEGAPRIPVIAAGGVYTGADICKYLRMGAAGVQMGTRFVATVECDADPDFKQAYLDAKKEDLMIIKSPVGLPGRVIRNPFIEKVTAGKSKPFSCPYHCLHGCEYQTAPYCISLALATAKQGDRKRGLIFAGQNAWRVNAIVPVQELIDSLAAEFDACCPEGLVPPS